MNRASLFPRQDNEKEPTMTDTSGPTSGRQFATYDHDSQSWRMWPDTGLWGSIEFSGTWPRTGCMSDGRAFELPTLAPPTTASDCSSSHGKVLPTPRTTDATNSMTAPSAMKHVADGFGTLPEVIGAKLMPTPAASDSKRDDNPSQALRKSPGLTTVSAHFPRNDAPVMPTPTASDATGGGQHPSRRVGHTRQLIDTVLGLTSDPTPPLFDDGSE